MIKVVCFEGNRKQSFASQTLMVVNSKSKWKSKHWQVEPAENNGTDISCCNRQMSTRHALAPLHHFF